jgi:hypothetical protein
MIGAGKGIAFQVHHEAIVQFIATKLCAEAKFGIMVGDQAILKGLRVQIAQCGNAAIHPQSGAVIDLMLCLLEKDADCAMQMHGGKATVVDCTICAHPKIGIPVQRGVELGEMQSHFASNGQREIHRA